MLKSPHADSGDVRDVGVIPGSGRCPGGGTSLCIPVFLPGTYHRQRSLAGYSPCGHKELDTTERPSSSSCRAWLHPHLEGAKQGAELRPAHADPEVRGPPGAGGRGSRVWNWSQGQLSLWGQGLRLCCRPPPPCPHFTQRSPRRKLEEKGPTEF